MRADRLLSLLMLLQSRKKVTADFLAKELEVTPRTIYRDLIALSSAGIPLYCERGPGGGISLIEDYRTTLTSLNAAEMKALFMVSIPPALSQLGMEKDLKIALQKLSASLPESGRKMEIPTRERILIDPTWWYYSPEKTPALELIQQALWQDQFLIIRYLSFQNTIVEQKVAPYGLVAKASGWYLVYGWQGTIRVRSAHSIIDARNLGESFTRPSKFNLGEFWKQWLNENETMPPYITRVRVSPTLLPTIRYHLEDRFRHLAVQAGETDNDGWTTLNLSFVSMGDARTRLLGMGRAVEVLAPEALRRSVIDFATQIVDYYQEGHL